KVTEILMVETRTLEVCKRFEFAAHHRLPFHKGKCSSDHGHNYFVTLCVYGTVRPDEGRYPDAGMVVDFARLKDEWKKVNEAFLDHKSLNSFLINPTAERLCGWLVEYFTEVFDQEGQLFLSRVRVEETSTSWVEWTRT